MERAGRRLARLDPDARVDPVHRQPWGLAVRRFRPNIVLDGAGENELLGRRIRVGSVVLDVMKRIDRCVMVTRAQPAGIERDLDVLRTVLRDSEAFLGIGAVVAAPGEIRVSDVVAELGPAGT